MTRPLAAATLGVALCLAGATFDSASLYVPGIALAVLAVGLTAWVRLAARGAGLVREPGPPTVVEEEPYPLRLELRAGALPPPGGELLEPLLGWPIPIAGRRSKRVRINVRFARRGRRRLEPATLVIRDPLHLHLREVRSALRPGGEELLVLPRVEPVTAAGGGAGGRAHGLAGEGEGQVGPRGEGSAVELEIDGLRPYRQGSPASRIHWPAVARTGEMLERRFVADADSSPLVVLDPTRPKSEADLDKAVRAAGSLALHLGRSGGCAVLLPGDRRPVELTPDLGAWPQVHARLALVTPDAGAPAASRARRSGAVFWVTAGGPGGIPRALDRLGAGSCYLVCPSPVPGHPTLFTVAGCAGQLLDRSTRRQRRAA